MSELIFPSLQARVLTGPGSGGFHALRQLDRASDPDEESLFDMRRLRTWLEELEFFLQVLQLLDVVTAHAFAPHRSSVPCERIQVIVRELLSW